MKKKEVNTVLSNQMLYTALDEIKKVVKTECSIWNLYGRCLTSTSDEIEALQEDVETYVLSPEPEEFLITKNGAYFMVREEDEPLFVFALHEIVENVEVIGRLCVNQIATLKSFQEKRVDKNRFIQQLLMDNLLLVDIYSQAKKLQMEIEEKRVVFIIEPKRQRDDMVFEILNDMYADSPNDMVTSVDENRIVLIKTLEADEDYEQIQETARGIVDALMSEAMVDVRVSCGTIIDELKDVSKSYKEANMALDVGRIFYKERNVLAYNDLGIGRLIHQLPVSLCEMFLKEVFRGNALEQIDDETLLTVNTFFENNLNISETARQMYLHRNTLSYRLDKIMKLTGLDVKRFDDALTFKIALMVSEHMKFLKQQS